MDDRKALMDLGLYEIRREPDDGGKESGWSIIHRASGVPVGSIRQGAVGLARALGNTSESMRKPAWRHKRHLVHRPHDPPLPDRKRTYTPRLT